MKPAVSQQAQTAPNTSAASSAQSALSLQFPQMKSEELNKVLDDVNLIRSKQKMVDDSLFNVKK
jgi:hypothetical protein